MKNGRNRIFGFVFISEFGNAGEVPFFTYVHRACTFLIACYDAFAYGTTYSIRPTKSNDPACGSGLPLPRNEHKLIKINSRTVIEIEPSAEWRY